MAEELVLTAGVAQAYFDDQVSQDTGLFRRYEFSRYTQITDSAARTISRNLPAEVYVSTGFPPPMSKGLLDLSGLTCISDIAFFHVTNPSLTLDLSGISCLSDLAAQCFREFTGFELRLNGLTSLSDTAASYLQELRAQRLCLDSLSKISTNMAKRIANSRLRSVTLHGLVTINADAFAEMLKFPGMIALNCLSSLPELEIGQILPVQLEQLSLPSLTQLTPESARLLGRLPCSLQLDGLNSIDAHIASLLVGEVVRVQSNLTYEDNRKIEFQEKKRIAFGRIRDLADDVVPLFSDFLGTIMFRGIRSDSDLGLRLKEHKKGKGILFEDHFAQGSASEGIATLDPDTATKILHKVLPRTMLREFTTASPTALRILCSADYADYSEDFDNFTCTTGSLWSEFGLTSIDERSASELSKLPGFLILDRLTDVTEEIVDAFSLSRAHSISLNGLTDVSDAVAASMSRIRNRNYGTFFSLLRLNGLRHLTESVASRLREFVGYLILDGLLKFPPETFFPCSPALSLNGLASLTPEQGELLAKTRLLCLNGLEKLHDETADSLSKHKGGKLILSGLKELSPRAAAAFGSHHVGRLKLDGIAHLEDESSFGLANHNGDLSLNGVQTLNATAAQHLSTVVGNLSLNGLTEISSDVAAHLGSRKRVLELNGVKSLTPETARHLRAATSSIELGGVERLSDEAFESLVTGSYVSVDLRGLKEISAYSAQMLFRTRKPLILNKNVSGTAAAIKYLNFCRSDATGLVLVEPQKSAARKLHPF